LSECDIIERAATLVGNFGDGDLQWKND
jgi:hypothetical protein